MYMFLLKGNQEILQLKQNELWRSEFIDDTHTNEEAHLFLMRLARLCMSLKNQGKSQL